MKHLATFIFCLLVSMAAHAQEACTATCNLTGTVNDYWPGRGDPVAGNRSITIGARRTGAGNTIAAGDLLLVIQMQDAVIDISNSAAYGSGGTRGMGYTNAGQSGRYEFVVATNAVGAGGGTVNLFRGLVNGYRSTVAGNQGRPTFQVIRVPHCRTATLTGNIGGLFWNGATGGVIALRATTLNTGNRSINANGIGFRGGATDSHNAPADTNNFGGNNTDDQFKGEGIAGEPRYLYDRSIDDEIDTRVNFPGGNRARGAPGNAGGGGEGDSGGGGGGNGGEGGVGGVFAPNPPGNPVGAGANGGGRGGDNFAQRSFSRVVMGGGGGGGVAGLNAGNPISDPWGTGGNAFSRGGSGGGIVLLVTDTRNGKITINANGESAPSFSNAANEAVQTGGGGGAGGSVVVYGGGGEVDVNAIGGNGGTSNRPNHYAHGGGGGGGVVFTAAGGTAAGSNFVVNQGLPGCRVSGIEDTLAGVGVCNAPANLFNSVMGTVGFSGTFGSVTTDAPGNPACEAAVSIAKDNGVGILTSGQTTTYTLTVTNQGPNQADGSVLRDPAAPGLSCTGLSCSSTPAGNCPTAGVTIANLQGSGITLTSVPANSTLAFSLACRVTATGQ